MALFAIERLVAFLTAEGELFHSLAVSKWKLDSDLLSLLVSLKILFGWVLR